MITTPVIPEYGEDIQKKYGGQQGAAVGCKFVAFGRDSIEAMKNAKRKGFAQDEVMLVGIPRLGAVYIPRLGAIHA